MGQVLQLGRDSGKLLAQGRFPLFGCAARAAGRARGGFAFLCRQPEELAGVGDVVLDEEVESLVEGEAFAEVAHLQLDGLAVEIVDAGLAASQRGWTRTALRRGSGSLRTGR